MKRECFFAQKLTTVDEEVLAGQVIDEKTPGSILENFERILDFIGLQGVPVAGKRNHLTSSSLEELNPLLTKPRVMDLERPDGKAFPHVSGLHLLLCAAGLAVVRCKGDERFLAIDARVLESWRGLDAVERYFTLLETWLLEGGREFSEDDGSYLTSPYLEWSNFVDALGKNGLKLRRRELLDPRGLCRSPGLRNIALMEMFGLISIRDSKPGRGESRQMDMARRTPLGDALGRLLRGFFTSEGFVDREETIRGFGRLQEIIKPFFPGWRNNLELPEIVFVDGVYTFKASLQKAWRRIAAPGANFFDDLGKTILEAFDFQDDHLYWFTWQNRFGAEETIHHPYMEGADALTDEIRIGEIGLQPGSSITFVFDFAALWKFNLQLESIDEKDPGLEKPKVIEAGGKPPAQYPEWDADSQWVFDDE